MSEWKIKPHTKKNGEYNEIEIQQNYFQKISNAKELKIL